MSETDSIVKVSDGNIVAIGGLMKLDSVDTRSGLPGLQDLPGVGGAFSSRNRVAVKKELVVLIKPSIVSSDSDDARETRDRINELGQSPNSVNVPWGTARQ